MFKRLVCIVLALLLALASAGCGNGGAPVPERAQELGYFVYPGLDWAMPEDETFEALGIDKASCDFKEESENPAQGNLAVIDHKYGYSASFLGDKVRIVLWFVKPPVFELYRLYSVTVIYPDETTREQFDEICEKLTKLMESQEIPTEGPWLVEDDEKTTWKLVSAAKKKDLPEELRKQYTAVSQKALEKYISLGASPLVGGQPVRLPDDALAADTNPLSRLNAVYWKNRPDGAERCYASFGGNQGLYLSYIDSYGELFDGDETDTLSKP